MPVSGLVITLDQNSARAERAVAKLQEDARVQLGERIGPLLPIAIDTRHREEDRLLRESLETMEGVYKVEIVFVGFDEDTGQETEPAVQPGSTETPPSTTDMQHHWNVRRLDHGERRP